MNDYLLKDAAKSLGINYSTAKTILRIFRIEKRIEKKNAEEEKELKVLIHKFKCEKVSDPKKSFTDEKFSNEKKNVFSIPLKSKYLKSFKVFINYVRFIFEFIFNCSEN